MPDKHEVGGSSPLGPTSSTKSDNEPLIKRKRLFSSKARDKFIKVVRVHLGLPQASKACKNLKVCAARPRAFLEREQSVKGKKRS